METTGRTAILTYLVIAILIISALGFVGMTMLEDDENEGDVIVIPDTGGEDTKESLIDIMMGSQSVRKDSIGPQVDHAVVVEDDPYLVLCATPRVVWYEGTTLRQYPMIVDSGPDDPAGDRFMELYPEEDATRIGNVEKFDSTFSTHHVGTYEEISLSIASTYWEQSDGAIIMSATNLSYQRSLPGIVLASYLNIPVILNEVWTGMDIEDTLASLGVKYTLVFDGSGGYGTTYRFPTPESIEDIVIRLLAAKFGGVSYVTLTNPLDLEAEHGLPGTSSLAPYLTAPRQGLICAAYEEPIAPGAAFREEADAFKANETTFRIKAKMMETMNLLDNHSLLNQYLDDSPYLAIMGSAYTIPFFYTYLTPKGIMASEVDNALRPIDITDAAFTPAPPTPPSGPHDIDIITQEPPEQNINDPALVPSDIIYADVDGDLTTLELAVGHPIGINLEDTSTLITRTFFYDEYLDLWESSSPLSQLLIVGDSWRNTGFIHCGDDWNGYVLISSPAYVQIFEYMNLHGYTTYTTIGTGETVNDVMKFFESSNLIFILAHGSQTGFHMIDGYTASDVKDMWFGPSSFVVTSCNVGNTDCPDLTDIDSSIALAIMRTGVNAFYGGMRYEYTGIYNPDGEYGMVTSGSPRLSQIMIKLTTEEDLTSGMTLRDGKNQYMSELPEPDEMDYDVAIKILYGDPMFNPYEP